MRLAAGFPGGLAEHGVERERLPELARLATREWTGTFNPRPLTERGLPAAVRSGLVRRR